MKNVKSYDTRKQAIVRAFQAQYGEGRGKITNVREGETEFVADVMVAQSNSRCYRVVGRDLRVPKATVTPAILVWTRAYRPFIMGGDCYAPIATSVAPSSGLIDLGRGYTGYEIQSPRGKTFVVESQTGGIVGASVEAVRRDIAAASEEVMLYQITEAQEERKKASHLPPAQFWDMLEHAKD